MKKNKNLRELIFEYDTDDACGILKLDLFFTKHIKNGDKIPARAFKILFSKVKIRDARLKNEIKKTISRLKEGVLNRYEKEYGFTFTYEREIIHDDDFFNVEAIDLNEKKPESDNVNFIPVTDDNIVDDKSEINSVVTENEQKFEIITANFPDMIDQVISRIQLNFLEIKTGKHRDNGKNAFIDLIYDCIDDYISNKKSINKDEAPVLIPFYCGVLTGYFLWKMEIVFFRTEKDATNQNLFDKVRKRVEKKDSYVTHQKNKRR